MAKKKKKKVEYRYYEMPSDSHILALQGEKWIQSYGVDIDFLHLHNYMEIGYCYEGTGELILEEESHNFRQKMFTVIPAGVLHTTNSTPDTVSRWEFLYLDIQGYLNIFYEGKSNYKNSLLERINARALFFKEKESPVLGELIRRILDEMREKKEYYKDNVTGLVLQLMVEIARLNEPDIKAVHTMVERKDEVIRPAVDYIHQHFDQDIRVETLAEMCFISENHFRRLFQERIHMTPIEYLNQTRIHAACDILRKSKEPIMDVARKTGFTTFSTFSRNFHRFVGVTPHEWRKRPENYEQKLLEYMVRTEAGW